MRELLIELQRELEVCWCPLDPAAGDLGARLAVERRVHLDGVEVLGIEAQLIETGRAGLLRSGRGIEESVPLPLAGRVVPARGSDVKAHARYNNCSGECWRSTRSSTRFRASPPMRGSRASSCA